MNHIMCFYLSLIAETDITCKLDLQLSKEKENRVNDKSIRQQKIDRSTVGLE